MRTSNLYVGFEVFTAVVMKSTIFWDIMLCSLLSVETSVDTQRTTWHYIPEDSTLQVTFIVGE
jgi:hypothetical protein